MSHVAGFPPLARPDARILILGSMPSLESLARQRYYAHPRNAFWPILCTLLDIRAEHYPERVEAAISHGIAIWDVLQACFRSGSLDADIDDSTIVTNDFAGFFREHALIERIFFNGAKAESVYRRQVLPTMEPAQAAIPLCRLPSTSPANAGMTREQKAEAWRIILDHGLK
jgi:hypoxanthine-DNA glycosylase